ncbi:MAG: hypothetical protein Q4C14_07550 [Bacillota bacterium]|nr:hypothetical protein [Bacillota bacterium]
MKKLFCLVLAGITAISLAACGGMPKFDSENLTAAQKYTYDAMLCYAVDEGYDFLSAEVMLTEDFAADMKGKVELSKWDVSDAAAVVYVNIGKKSSEDDNTASDSTVSGEEDKKDTSEDEVKTQVAFFMNAESQLLDTVVIKSGSTSTAEAMPFDGAADGGAADSGRRELAEIELAQEELISTNSETMIPFVEERESKLKADPEYIYSAEYLNLLNTNQAFLKYDEYARKAESLKKEIELEESSESMEPAQASKARSLFYSEEKILEKKLEYCTDYAKLKDLMEKCHSENKEGADALLAKAESIKKTDENYLYNKEYVKAAVSNKVKAYYEYQVELANIENCMAAVDEALTLEDSGEIDFMLERAEREYNANEELLEALMGYAGALSVYEDFEAANAAELKAYQDASDAAKKAAGDNYEKDIEYIKVQVKYEDLINKKDALKEELSASEEELNSAQKNKEEVYKNLEEEEAEIIEDAAVAKEKKAFAEYIKDKKPADKSEYDAAAGEWGYLHPDYEAYQNEHIKRPVKTSSGGGGYKSNSSNNNDDGGIKYDKNDELYREHDYNNDGKINDQEFQDALGDYMDQLMGY